MAAGADGLRAQARQRSKCSGSSREAEGEAMKVLERLTLVPKDLACGVVAHSQGLSTPEGSCRGQRSL